jgi:tRNA 2-thiouridine synthesizing protein C
MNTPDEPSNELVAKRFLYVNRKAPHGTVYALESLEMVLIAAMYEQDVHVAFLDDGVFQLKKGQRPNDLDMKDFSKTYRALDGYGVEKIYVERESMEARGLSSDDFVIPVMVIGRTEMTDLMNSMDVVLSA